MTALGWRCCISTVIGAPLSRLDELQKINYYVWPCSSTLSIRVTPRTLHLRSRVHLKRPSAFSTRLTLHLRNLLNKPQIRQQKSHFIIFEASMCRVQRNRFIESLRVP